MKQYDFDEVIKRDGTGCVKWEKKFDTSAKNIYPLWVADMDFSCSDAIIEALHNRVDERIYGYNLGYDASYRKAVCSWFRRRFDWKINPRTIYYAGGIVPAIGYLLEILSKEGDGIVIQTPVYHPFRKKIEATKRLVVNNPLINTSGYYTMNYQHLEELMKRRDVKGMILCSPHNPGGRVWKQEELLEVVRIAKQYDKWIIADEIHCDIVRKDILHTPLLKLAPEYATRIIACTAPSKSFNLAGLQISNIIICNQEYQAKWKSFVEERLSLEGANSFAISATKAAYNDSEDWLNQVNDYIDENMRIGKIYIEQHLPNAVVSPVEGTYLLWVDVRRYSKSQQQVETALLKEGIIFHQGAIFGEEGIGFLRMNVACPRTLLCECLALFVNIMNTIENAKEQ